MSANGMTPPFGPNPANDRSGSVCDIGQTSLIGHFA
jgi:hypothetical protein